MQRLILALALLAPSVAPMGIIYPDNPDVTCGDFTIPPEKPAGDNGIRRGGYVINALNVLEVACVGEKANGCQGETLTNNVTKRCGNQIPPPRHRRLLDILGCIGARADAHPPMDTPFPFPTMKPTTRPLFLSELPPPPSNSSSSYVGLVYETY